jgi:2-keto-4-pentenoate hydratase
MPPSITLDRVVGLYEARRSRQPAEVPGFDLDSAGKTYRMQDAVAAKLGPVTGWKVGAKSREAIPSCAPLVTGALGQPAARHERRVQGHIVIAFVLGRAFPAPVPAPTRRRSST